MSQSWILSQNKNDENQNTIEQLDTMIYWTGYTELIHYLAISRATFTGTFVNEWLIPCIDCKLDPFDPKSLFKVLMQGNILDIGIIELKHTGYIHFEYPWACNRVEKHQQKIILHVTHTTQTEYYIHCHYLNMEQIFVLHKNVLLWNIDVGFHVYEFGGLSLSSLLPDYLKPNRFNVLYHNIIQQYLVDAIKQLLKEKKTTIYLTYYGIVSSDLTKKILKLYEETLGIYHITNSPFNLSNDIEICIICRDEVDSIIVELSCKHKYHSECLLKWCRMNASCPLCKQKINLI